MCMQETGGERRRANMERWQYKIEFNYKTTSHANAKIILQSPGVEREDFPGRKHMC